LKLGLELLAREPTPLSLGTFFETWLAAAGGTVKRSLGRDEYHLGLTIGAGRRLAATGRTHICQLDVESLDLGLNQARPALLVPADLPPGAPLCLGVRTNRFLDLNALAAGVWLRLVRDTGPPVEVSLEHVLLDREEIAPGRYLLELGTLLFT
jgi:hypothetical protein